MLDRWLHTGRFGSGHRRLHGRRFARGSCLDRTGSASTGFGRYCLDDSRRATCRGIGRRGAGGSARTVGTGRNVGRRLVVGRRRSGGPRRGCGRRGGCGSAGASGRTVRHRGIFLAARPAGTSTIRTGTRTEFVPARPAQSGHSDVPTGKDEARNDQEGDDRRQALFERGLGLALLGRTVVPEDELAVFVRSRSVGVSVVGGHA
ncbi:hypothetical protein BRC86_09275 [Halobacteriales archaeon QS_3_64_16]|nr:MAG: hypothetical protein BRC86_09275 [Halobacteriales archaeon QS_3_64_16]